jgi:hypothetical protein
MKFVDQTDDIQFQDPERDIPNLRIVHLQNGRKLKLERRDPFGFVYIAWDKGHPPSHLQGSYTDFDQARRALENYLSNNTFETISEEPTEKVAPLKYKKKFRDPETDENLAVNG